MLSKVLPVVFEVFEWLCLCCPIVIVLGNPSKGGFEGQR